MSNVTISGAEYRSLHQKIKDLEAELKWREEYTRLSDGTGYPIACLFQENQDLKARIKQLETFLKSLTYEGCPGYCECGKWHCGYENGYKDLAQSIWEILKEEGKADE